ncbi:sensor histidine kinase [Paenibacillus sedimenti]|uniref:sensor histidine kinase n=1 Tax=Paenibacillus sedimenti TaxID=2770274 RepID=UPI00165FF146|nr:HAMP domain-containing sensor histidine kinase [Paenibacillus sedimenti]
MSLWTVGFTLLIKNRKSAFSRSMGYSFLAAGTPSFAFSIHLVFIPLLERLDLLTPSLRRLLEWISIPAIHTYWYSFAYFILISAIVFSGFFSTKSTRIATFLLIIPVLVMIGVTADFNIPFEFEVKKVRLFFALYLIAAFLLYFASCIKEQDHLMRKNRYRTTVLVVSATMLAYLNDFIGMVRFSFGSGPFQIESNGMWKFNYLIILWVVAYFFFYGVKYGFMGIKLRIEDHKHDYSMRHLTEGTQILNHAIKNELQKINYLNARAMTLIDRDQKEQTRDALRSLSRVSDHLLDMMNRLKDKAEDIVLQEGEHRLSELIDQTLATIKPLLENGNSFHIGRQYDVDGLVVCDATHVRELLSNVCLNAIDALPREDGCIRITTKYVKNSLYIYVKDNGKGIPEENRKRIFDPFFTTKKNTSSYGLGLSYCYSVMNKHGGKIGIAESEIGKGTTLYIKFPGRRFRIDTGR